MLIRRCGAFPLAQFLATMPHLLHYPKTFSREEPHRQILLLPLDPPVRVERHQRHRILLIRCASRVGKMRAAYSIRTLRVQPCSFVEWAIVDSNGKIDLETTPHRRRHGTQNHEESHAIVHGLRRCSSGGVLALRSHPNGHAFHHRPIPCLVRFAWLAAF